jgi:hypothetical protein
MDLRHSDTEESIAAQVCIRLVDAGNGGKADPGQIQDLAEPPLRWIVRDEKKRISSSAARRICARIITQAGPGAKGEKHLLS